MPPATQQPPPRVRVIVRLPYNRPSEGFENPPQIEWNSEKEGILWEVIARSRASDGGGRTDWQGLAEHLAVPLPYLLFRTQTRFEEDLKGLRTLGPLNTTALTRVTDDDGKISEKPELVRKLSDRVTGSTRMSGSGRLNTPLGIRARLNSLSHESTSRQSKASSSSTLTLQGARNLPPPILTSPIENSDSDSESEEEAIKAEEEERRLEEQDALERKLKHLQDKMTSNTVGLVRDIRPKAVGQELQRGRDPRSPTSPSPLRQTYQQRDMSSSDFNSSTSSPQGSIPSIPSPPPEPQAQFTVARHMHAQKSSSPPAVSPGQARGQAHIQYRPIPVGMVHTSDKSSTQGSTTSSFSDISESTSLSASALESALLSNIRGTGSRFSAFARSQFGRRASKGPQD
ncbi:autophagy-related 29 [Pyrrhoderma noxium]|uniref:Autophagy-related protein 29 n=1 Tax=Pyrrhoderma noxium TaxID=2282107 RepID=A0A286UN96_9AGAM|nr:autophagy-related 29 [Pyrrhoderma noxium]